METSVTRTEKTRVSVGISTKDTDMSFASSFQERMGGIFAFIAPNRPIKDAIPRAAKFLGLGERRVRAIWAQEARTLQVADEEALFDAEVRISEHILSKEVEKHADRLEYAALKLSSKCPVTYRERIDQCRALARRFRARFDREGA